MSIFEAFLIGLIQGLTEFLPVSSSGHMLLVGRILGLELSLGLQLVMHLATLFAVLIVMKKQVLDLIRKPLGKDMLLVVLATLPTVVIVFFLRDVVENVGSALLPYCFIITAILLLLSGFVRHHKKEISYLDALIIGTVQGMAAFPGISRSGSTISASVLLGGEKQSSARFSFLLSIPIIIGSAAVELISGGGLGGGLGLGFLPLMVGFAAAFASGYLALKFIFTRLLSFDYFAVYLLALSILLLLNDIFLHWF